MSRTDKTDPHEVKVARLHPLANIYWRPEFGCGQSCPVCGIGAGTPERRRKRREGKRQVRNWQREYA